MTPKERARKAVQLGLGSTFQNHLLIHEKVAKEIADAEDAVRRRCYKAMELANMRLFEAVRTTKQDEIIELVQDAREVLGAAICQPPAESEVPAEDNSPETTRDILGLVERDVPLAVVAGWTEHKRKLAGDWAGALHLLASDNDVNIPPEPSWVQRYDPRAESDGGQSRGAG